MFIVKENDDSPLEYTQFLFLFLFCFVFFLRFLNKKVKLTRFVRPVRLDFLINQFLTKKRVIITLVIIRALKKKVLF